MAGDLTIILDGADIVEGEPLTLFTYASATGDFANIILDVER